MFQILILELTYAHPQSAETEPDTMQEGTSLKHRNHALRQALLSLCLSETEVGADGSDTSSRRPGPGCWERNPAPAIVTS